MIETTSVPETDEQGHATAGDQAAPATDAELNAVEGGSPRLTADGAEARQFFAYSPSFTGGVFVATGD